MTTAAHTRHQQRQVAAHMDRLRHEGWELDAQPDSSSLPEPLRTYRPELVATRGDERLVIEFVGRHPARPSGELEALARALAQLPGWTLNLVMLSDDDPLAAQEQLRQRAERARRLADVDPEAALLLAWSAAEGALRRLADRAAVSLPAGSPIAELYSRDLLTDEQYQLLHEVQRQRNALAHGRQARPVAPDTVRRLAELVHLGELDPAGGE